MEWEFGWKVVVGLGRVCERVNVVGLVTGRVCLCVVVGG